MATIIEDYVSFEVAKLLKEKGFDESIRCWYDNFQNFHEEGVRMCNTDCLPPTIMCPTLQMAMKWLREVHNLFLAVGFGADAKGEFLYMADIYNLRNDAIDGIYKPIVEADDYLLNNPKSYEEACEAAIKYCLENLI